MTRGPDVEPVALFPEGLEKYRSEKDASDLGIRKWIAANEENLCKALDGISTDILDNGFIVWVYKSENKRTSLSLDFRRFTPTQRLLGGQVGECCMSVNLHGIYSDQFNEIEILPESYGIRLKQTDRYRIMEAYIDSNFRVSTSITPLIGVQR